MYSSRRIRLALERERFELYSRGPDATIRLGLQVVLSLGAVAPPVSLGRSAAILRSRPCFVPSSYLKLRARREPPSWVTEGAADRPVADARPNRRGSGWTERGRSLSKTNYVLY